MRKLRHFSVDIYLSKAKDRNTRTDCEICLKLTMKTPERSHRCRSDVFIVNFENIFTPCSSIFIVHFECGIAGWVNTAHFCKFPKRKNKGQGASQKYQHCHSPPIHLTFTL